MRFALDTNSLIYFFRGEGQVARRLLATPPGRILIPAVVLYELETWLAKSSEPAKRRAQLARLIDVVTLLPFGAAEARAAASLRARLEILGTPIGPMDTLIAGTALVAGATLVTHNIREFGRVPGLFIEDWYNAA